MSNRVLPVYQADQTNIARLWDLTAQRSNHLKKLSTIYKQKQQIRAITQKDHINRQKQIEKYQRSKLQDFNNKNKALQDKINYQNSILRNKILGIHRNTNPLRKRKSNSMYIRNQVSKISPHKNVETSQEMYKTNLKLGYKIKNIKSQVGAVCNDEEHLKQNAKLLQMLQKKSPKKKAYLRNLVTRKINTNPLFPQLNQKLLDQIA